MRRLILAAILVAMATAAYAQLIPPTGAGGQYVTDDFGNAVTDDYGNPVPIQ